MCTILHDWLCTHGCSQVAVGLCVFSCEVMHVCVACAACVWVTCTQTCVNLGLLHELVLSVCECGRGRPSACQYVLMLHIWFPNFPPCFPPSLNPCPPLRSPRLRCQDTVLFFQGWWWWRGGGAGDGGDVWWVMAVNTGRQHSPSPSLSLLCSLSVFPTPTSYEASENRSGVTCIKRMKKRSSLLCLHLFVFTPPHVSLSSRASPSSEKRWQSPTPYFFFLPYFSIIEYICLPWCTNSKLKGRRRLQRRRGAVKVFLAVQLNDLKSGFKPFAHMLQELLLPVNLHLQWAQRAMCFMSMWKCSLCQQWLVLMNAYEHFC